jgi:putative effector of murein hydrolase
VIWVFADWLAQLSGRNPLVNPVMIAIAAVSASLLATGTSYSTS